MRTRSLLLYVVLIIITCTLYGTPDFRQIVANDMAQAKAKASRVSEWYSYLHRDTRPMDNFDATAYTIEASVSLDTESISGTTTVSFTAIGNDVSTIDLDFLDNMVVDAITVGGTTVTYTHANDILHISLPSTLANGATGSIAITYHGNPIAEDFIGGGMFFHPHNGTPAVYTCVEPFAARSWWPCKDVPGDKADTVDLIITCDSDYTAACNGVLLSEVDNGNGTKTFHWHESHPISTYLVAVAITNYQVYSQTYTGMDGTEMPVTHYIFPELWDDSVELLGQTPECIDILAGYYGEYPFLDEKYGHALAANMGGAMENQTLTSINSSIMNPWYISTVVHELAHQWCGDLITCADWANIWLNEGMATFSEALYYENLYGIDAFHEMMDSNDNGAGIDDKLERDPDANGDEVLDWVVYGKGAWVMTMLRYTMGDEDFFQMLHNYFADPNLRYGNATTADLCAHAEAVTGLDMDWFFDEWFTRVGRPQYQYAVYTREGLNENLIGILSTGNHGETFDMPIPLRIDDNEGRVFIGGGWNHFGMNGDASTLIWDPDNWILDNGFTLVNLTLDEFQQNRNGSTIIFLPEWFDTSFYGYHVFRTPTGQDNWTRLTTDPVTGSIFTDSTGTVGTSYDYRIAAVYEENGDEYLTRPSNSLTVMCSDFPLDEGILLVDNTFDYTTGMPGDSLSDAFYDDILHGYHVTKWDISDQGVPNIATLSRYSSVIWTNDDVQQTPFTNAQYTIESYIANGGHLILSSWRNLSLLSSELTEPFLHFTNCSSVSAIDFVGAIGSNGFVNQPVDPGKVISSAWNGHLPFVSILTASADADTLYTYDSSTDNPAVEGAACAIRVPGQLYVFGFPLYFSDTATARSLMDTMLADLGELVNSDNPATPPTRILVTNHPNPFNPETTLEYSLPAAGKVTIDIYNTRGERVRRLLRSECTAGTHIVDWNGENDNGQPLASGIYFARIACAGATTGHKMLLLR